MFLSYTLHRTYRKTLLRHTSNSILTRTYHISLRPRYSTKNPIMPDFYDPAPYRLQPTDTERLSDIMKVSPSPILSEPVQVLAVTSSVRVMSMTDTNVALTPRHPYPRSEPRSDDTPRNQLVPPPASLEPFGPMYPNRYFFPTHRGPIRRSPPHSPIRPGYGIR